MKPVVIFRHALTEGAGYLGAFLTENKIPWQMVRIDQGDTLPDNMEGYSGMVLMGGPMSVNDDLPWIKPLLALTLDAMNKDIPVLGHCLGGQLISKALGAKVSKNPVKEIGWGEVVVTPSAQAQEWFGIEMDRFNAFHWHGETFALPEGATHLLASAYCDNQAYSIGKHLAFQCHIEMTSDMVRVWCEVGSDEVAAASSPGVQTVEQMQQALADRIAELNGVSRGIYGRWIRGLKS